MPSRSSDCLAVCATLPFCYLLDSLAERARLLLRHIPAAEKAVLTYFTASFPPSASTVRTLPAVSSRLSIALASRVSTLLWIKRFMGLAP